jgi:methyl-accepting chemotaxis protein
MHGMRENLPVTQNEHVLPDGAMLVSKTDLKGRITFCNEAFVAASGFSVTELMGKAHNIVRHPDMPEEAFADLWRTLKAGKPWTALVKNRRKNGDFYWVLANATPVRHNGVVTEYMSVRSKPSREQVAAAGALYKQFREKRAAGLLIREGKLEHSGLRGATRLWRVLTLIHKTALLGSVAALALVLQVTLPASVGGAFHHGLMLGLASLGLVGLAGLAVIMVNAAHTLRAAAVQVDELAQGNFERIFDASGEDELSALQRSLQSLRTKVGFELADSRRLAVEGARIRQALDVAAANVMLADASHDVIYANQSLMTMLKTAETDIRARIPGFEATSVIGSNIDRFHVNPGHQRSMLQSLAATHRTRLELGQRKMDIIITPILDDAKLRIGTVVEWADRTQELNTEAQIANIVTAATSGDLTQRVATEGMTGFFATVANGLNALLENMTSLVSKVQDAVAAVRGGADEISKGNLDLSRRTEQQAAALEEAASSMEQMASAAQLGAEHAQQTDQLARTAREQAESGGQVVSETITAMRSIDDSSKRIANITGVIDEIAFQTNLLALNAAVEAARAGEQGRSFAVVASEVRALASRSAAAAKEIKELIEDSVKKVGQGRVLVDKSGHALTEILNSVTKVTSIITEMSTTSREQATGLEQVNKAVMSLDEVTQQNAALVEQASAAAHSLLEQAGQLDDMMTRYVVNQGQPETTSMPRARVA